MLWIVGVSLIMALVSGAPIAAVVAGSATILIMACLQTRHMSILFLCGAFVAFAAGHCFFAQQVMQFDSMGMHSTDLTVIRFLSSDLLLSLVAAISATIGAIVVNEFCAELVSGSDLPQEKRRDDDAEKN